ncbi:MAG: response regulator transcription factor [Pseudomonadota bacterium]
MPTPDDIYALLIEDDAGIGRVIRNGLRNHGINLEWIRTGTPALSLLKSAHFDVVILDLMLPDIDGFELCRQIRSMGSVIPICMLTARDALEDKLEGFEVGADEYVTKPFEIEELVARLGALVRRRYQGHEDTKIVFGSLEVDTLAREATVDGSVLDLTLREFDVLTYLARHPRQVVSRSTLLQVVWGAAREVTLNTTDVYVGYLRRKLAVSPDAPQIKTVRGVGFKLS